MALRRSNKAAKAQKSGPHGPNACPVSVASSRAKKKVSSLILCLPWVVLIRLGRCEPSQASQQW